MNEVATDSVLLRTFKEDDQARLARLCNNRNIWDNVRDLLPSPYSKQNAIEFIELCQKQDPPVTFAIEYNGEFVGCIGLTRQEDVYRMSAEIGFWIGEPYWGLGIATQSLGLLTDYAFNTLGLVRVYAGVFDFNLASQRVLEKSGYKLEGQFEKSVLKNGRFCNEYRFAKVREE